MTQRLEHIRNFCIIAHIDHGKSTLADRFLEATNTLDEKQMRNQVLDSMDLERERGITIKSHPVRMNYTANDGRTYQFNLIDTPGHVDFTYEVSRSLAACEGAILVVDAAQGIQAQTISNVYLAMEANLDIVPVINKVDLPSARVEFVKQQLVDLLGVGEEEIFCVSARFGEGVGSLLDALPEKISPPRGNENDKLRALIFDSFFNSYKGAVVYVRVFDGTLKAGDGVRSFWNDKVFETAEVGLFRPAMVPVPVLAAGDVGYVITGIKSLKDTKVGDTLTLEHDPASGPLPGYKEIKPMVFSGLYPVNADDYEGLRDALDKLQMNDAAFTFEPESSVALGFGFRGGFLGLLHMEVIQERLEREYALNLITTVPNVKYTARLKNDSVVAVENPARMPPAGDLLSIEEPMVKAEIITPDEYVGAIMKLNQERRGIYREMSYLGPGRAVLIYELPLAEILIDYYDRLKSMSKGYASLDYEYLGYRASDLTKLDIALNGEPVDALSMIVHREKAYNWGRDLTSRLKEVIPRQLFEVVIQAVVGSKVVSRPPSGRCGRTLRPSATAETSRESASCWRNSGRARNA
jgi:GTP-binding protein LepA